MKEKVTQALPRWGAANKNMDSYNCQSLVGGLPEYKVDLYAWLNQNVTINHQHNVVMERSTGNSEYFQQGISNVLAKPLYNTMVSPIAGWID